MTSVRRMAADLELVRDEEHYTRVIERVLKAEVSVWIGTANLKDLHVEASVGTRARARGRYASALESLASMAGRGVDVRILYAATPSRPFQRTLAGLGGAKGPGARGSGIQLRQCPRVHLKMIAIDGGLLYLGSANFTGAGLGARGAGRRNFEAGIATDDEYLLDQMQQTFDRIWSGAACKGCKLRRECPIPIDTIKS